MKRVVVVGAGLAGLLSATALAKAGFAVTCAAFGTGGLPLGPGVIDVCGYGPELVASPLRAVAGASSASGNPYATIGADATRRGLQLLRGLAGPQLLAGDPETNVLLPTAVGGWRPACLYQPRMAAGLTAVDATSGQASPVIVRSRPIAGGPGAGGTNETSRRGPSPVIGQASPVITQASTSMGAAKPVSDGLGDDAEWSPPADARRPSQAGAPLVIVGLKRCKDFWPSLIAANLRAGGATARAASVDVVARRGEVDSSGMVFARFFDTDAGRAALVRALRAVVEPGETVGLPAVLGLDDHAAWRKVQDALGQPVSEIPLPPPSVPGWRLNRTLVAAAQSAGVRFIWGSQATVVEQRDGRATGVVLASAGHPTTLPADAVVLAPGGLRSSGLTIHADGHVAEPLMGLTAVQPRPVPKGAGDRDWRWAPSSSGAGSGHSTSTSPDGRPSPFTGDAFGPQPAFLTGVRNDENMRPLDASGRPACANVYAVGGLLGGSVRWDELTGDGIAAGSAAAAVEAIEQELK